MQVWAYDPRKKQRMYPIEDIISLYPERNTAIQGQNILRDLHQSRLWLVCDCHSPNPLMYVRKESSGKYSIVNHSEHGLHEPGCRFFTQVKGAPRELGNVAENGDASLKKDRYSFYNTYKDSAVTTQASLSGSSSQSSNLDSLVRLIWQLADDSNNQVYDDLDNSVLRKLMRLRYAAEGIRLGRDMVLKDYLFVGGKGYQLLKNTMSDLFDESPGIRHQSLLLLAAQKARHQDNTLEVVDESGQVIVIDNVDRPPVTVHRLGLEFCPSLLALAFTFDSPHEKTIHCHRWVTLMCHSLDNLIILNTLYEKIYLELLLSSLQNVKKNHNINYYIAKPALSYVDNETGEYYHPNFSVGLIANENMTLSVAVLVKDEVEASAYCTLEGTKEVSERIYDNVMCFEPKKFASADALASNFLHEFEKVTASFVATGLQVC